MSRRFTTITVALCVLALPMLAHAAPTQVGADYFNQPTNHLINFDTDPGGNPIADGQLLQNVYSSLGVTFDSDDRAVAMYDGSFGTSAPNQAAGSANELSSMNIYFGRGVDAAGAWGYDFAMRAFGATGNLILEIHYTDGHPCPEAGSFREQRFLGIASDTEPIFQVQFFRHYQDQTACGYRIDDFQFLQQELPPPPTPLPGNLQITWGNCVGNPGSTPAAFFDCSPGSGAAYSLVGTFQLLDPIADFVAVDISMDLILDGQSSLSPFWHFEQGGCNDGGISIDDVRPAGCVGFSTPWGATGNQSLASITAYLPGNPFANYGRILATVARSLNDPIAINGSPSRYFAFVLFFTMDNSGSCTGCDTPGSLRVNGMSMFTASSSGGPSGQLLGGPQPGSVPCATFNGGGSACDVTPTKSLTWGKLKSLYR
jgi:hypothetical protein